MRKCSDVSHLAEKCERFSDVNLLAEKCEGDSCSFSVILPSVFNVTTLFNVAELVPAKNKIRLIVLIPTDNKVF